MKPFRKKRYHMRDADVCIFVFWFIINWKTVFSSAATVRVKAVSYSVDTYYVLLL